MTFLKTKEGQAATGYEEETMNLMLSRWLKLQKDFYDARTDRFDLSKVGKRALCHVDSHAVRLHQVRLHPQQPDSSGCENSSVQPVQDSGRRGCASGVWHVYLGEDADRSEYREEPAHQD